MGEMGLERRAGPGNARHLGVILSMMDTSVGLGGTVMGPELLCLLFYFLAVLCGTCDLRSVARDRTWCPLRWKHRFLATGPPGGSQVYFRACFLQQAQGRG